MAISLPAVIWFWIWVSWFCGRKKDSLIGWIWVMVTSGVAPATVIRLPGWMMMGPVLPSIGETILV